MSDGPTPRAGRARPIGTRLFFLVGVGMVGPALVVAWAGASANGELERRADARDAALASAAAERLSTALAQGLEAVNAVATQEAWSDAPESVARLREAVRRARVHHHALFDAFFALDESGTAVAGDAASLPAPGPTLVAEALRLGRPGYLTFGAEGRRGLDVVALVPLAPGRGADARVVGARVAHDSERLARLLGTTGLAEGQGLELRDAAGQRVASTGPQLADDGALRDALSSAVGPASGACLSCAGGGVAWTVAPVGLAHWTVVLRRPLSLALGFQRGLALQMGLAALALVVLALLFAWGATASVTRPLTSLTRSAERLASGDLAAPITARSGDEVGTLAEALEVMRRSVQQARAQAEELNTELERRVAARTEELSKANAKLAAREAERTRLVRQLIFAQEDERKRIARELHDQTSQDLVALTMGIDAAAPRLAEPGRAELHKVRAHAATALSGVHRLILDLRPTVLDDLGLESAIRWCAERTLSSRGVTVRCEFSGLERRLPVELETAVFRAAQEALTNVARHAHAESALVQAQLRAGHLELEVEDDGQGFTPRAVPKRGDDGRGLGLLGMRERVEAFGGSFFVDSAPGQGTHVRLEVPVPPESEEARHG